MAREDARTACSLRCWRRHGDEASGEHVDWAGLPINLDWAFSREQRDKVYAQHLMRKQRAQQWGWPQVASHLCVCEIEFHYERADQDRLDASSISRR